MRSFSDMGKPEKPSKIRRMIRSLSRLPQNGGRRINGGSLTKDVLLSYCPHLLPPSHPPHLKGGKKKKKSNSKWHVLLLSVSSTFHQSRPFSENPSKFCINSSILRVYTLKEEERDISKRGLLGDMEAIKRQASKLREQVAKQQQALLRQIGHFDPEAINADEAEIAQHGLLENFYSSTRAAKHFEKDMLHGIERFIIASSKQIEIERRFAHDCCSYQTGNHCSTSPLAEAALHVGASRNVMIKEKETLLGVFDEQICKQLRALVKSAELEDARHLTRRYDKLWQDVEDQAAEVQRLRSKPIEGPKSGEHVIKLQAAEEKLDELKSRLKALGTEATSAMQSVEDQQQQMTFQQLVIMVNAERSFHRNVLTVLDKLHAQMMRMEQSNISCSSPDAMKSLLNTAETEGNTGLNGNKKHRENQDRTCFAAKVVIPFDAEAEGELSLSVDDTVVVQQVAPGGWSKGESNGKTGWFPSPYVKKLEEDPKDKMTSTKQ